MPRFVLLEHRWNGVHWDFMLETDDGPLRTWAINQAIEPGVNLPARALADHRSIYLDYEGEVSGGRGVVRRIDRGTYVREIWTDDIVKVRLSGAQLLGPVELRRAVSGVDFSSSDREDWVVRFGNLD